MHTSTITWSKRLFALVVAMLVACAFTLGNAGAARANSTYLNPDMAAKTFIFAPTDPTWQFSSDAKPIDFKAVGTQPGEGTYYNLGGNTGDISTEWYIYDAVDENGKDLKADKNAAFGSKPGCFYEARVSVSLPGTETPGKEREKALAFAAQDFRAIILGQNADFKLDYPLVWSESNKPAKLVFSVVFKDPGNAYASVAKNKQVDYYKQYGFNIEREGVLLNSPALMMGLPTNVKVRDSYIEEKVFNIFLGRGYTVEKMLRRNKNTVSNPSDNRYIDRYHVNFTNAYPFTERYYNTSLQAITSNTDSSDKPTIVQINGNRIPETLSHGKSSDWYLPDYPSRFLFGSFFNYGDEPGSSSYNWSKALRNSSADTIKKMLAFRPSRTMLNGMAGLEPG